MNVGLAAATGGAGELAPAVAKALAIVFGTKLAAQDLPQQLGQLSADPSPENISDTAINALMLAGLGKGVMPEKAPAPLPPGPYEHVAGEPDVGYRKRFSETPPLIGQRPINVEQPVLQLRQEAPGYIVKPSDIQSPRPPIEELGGRQLVYGNMVEPDVLPPEQRQGVTGPSGPYRKPSSPPTMEQYQAQLEKRNVEKGLLGSGINTDYEDYQRLMGLMKEALGRKDYDEFCKLQQQTEAIKNRNPERPGMPPSPPTAPVAKTPTKADLRPAIEVNGKLLVGNVGDTHADVLARNGINPETIPHESPQRGFTVDGKTLINRTDAAKIAGERGTAAAGGLDSQDLFPGGNPNAIRELRAGSIPETQAPSNLQKVGEEVRQGADAEGATRQAQEDVNRPGTFYSGMPLKLERNRPKGDLEGFWMHSVGHLIPETQDYQLAREIVDKEPAKTPSPEQISDEGAKRLEQEMMSKGFTKVVRQGDTYFVDNNVSNHQLAGIRNQAKSEGRTVQTIDFHAGLNPFDPELLTRVLDKFYGHGVKRDPEERLKHFEANLSGWSAPHHAIATEDVGNKLVRYAAADIYASELGLSGALGGAFRRGYKELALKDWIEAGIRDGVYEYAKSGVPSTITGPTKAFQVSIRGVGHKTLRVRADLAPEFDQALNGTGMPAKAGAQLLVDLLTEAQIAGPTDVIYHLANMYSSIVKSPGKVGNYYADQMMRVYGVKQLDAMARIGWNMYKTMSNDPAVRAELAKLAQIGALRGEEGRSPFLAKITGGVIDTGRWIRVIDRAGRYARSRMYDNLVEQGLVTDNELDRREFVNKMGQYNAKLMSHWQANLKNITSQFVVAGRTFNRNAAQSILASNEFRSAAPSAYAKAKLSNIMALMSTAIVVPIVANAVITGKPFGRAGVPLGKIDTGKDDEQGRPITVDPMKTDLSRRGARNLGVEDLLEGVKAKRDPVDIGARMIKSIGLGIARPWMGPPVRMGEEFLGTYKATGNATDSIKAAIRAVNPLVYGSVFGYPEENSKGGVKELGQQTVKQAGEAFGVGSGRILSNIEKVEKVTGKPVEQTSLRERVKAEQQVKSEKLPTSAMEQAKIVSRAATNEAKRGDEVKASFDKGTKQWLESRQLIVPGYDNKLEYGKTKVYLTGDESKRLDALVKEEYLATIDKIKSSAKLADFDGASIQKRQEVFHRMLAEAARRAKDRLGKELYDKTPDSDSNAQNLSNTQKKRKRYSFIQGNNE
jgi:hypothetical protein